MHPHIRRQYSSVYAYICEYVGLYRALDLAIKYKTHVDTVLAYRQKYLQSLDRPETDEKFLKMRDVAIDWAAIQAKIEQENKKEEARGTPYRSSMPNVYVETPNALSAGRNFHHDDSQ